MASIISNNYFKILLVIFLTISNIKTANSDGFSKDKLIELFKMEILKTYPKTTDSLEIVRRASEPVFIIQNHLNNIDTLSSQMYKKCLSYRISIFNEIVVKYNKLRGGYGSERLARRARSVKKYIGILRFSSKKELRKEHEFRMSGRRQSLTKFLFNQYKFLSQGIGVEEKKLEFIQNVYERELSVPYRELKNMPCKWPVGSVQKKFEKFSTKREYFLFLIYNKLDS